MSTIKSVVKRNGAIVAFNPDRITNAIYRAAVEMGGRDRATAERLSQQVVQILQAQTPPEHIPTVEEIQDIVEKVLIENGHARVAKAYILYRAERARLRHAYAHTGQTPRDAASIPWAKLWHALDWAVERGVNTVAGLNARIARGEFPSIVQEAEAMYGEEIKNAATLILERRAELKTVIITGPSSSGKTTTTIKIGERLKRAGLNLVTLNVDNYFFDLELHPKDEFGDYDFETPHALDLALISQHLARLIAGEEVRIPFYDMKTGKRYLERTPMKLQASDLILIDSLHGLFPEMTKDVPPEQKFKLYLEPLLQMKGPDNKYVRWTDLRLIRRMLRDAAHRAYDPRRTLLHWHYVRGSEMRNIIPRITETGCIVNTGLAFELPLYPPRLLDQFTRWEEEFQNDPLREDAYTRAKRVHALLQAVTPVEDDSPVPPDSVLREFIGGSVYEY
jgi:uridine kinase